MFVKICGLTDRAGLDAAVEAGADAVGFVFAESVREIDPVRAKELCRDLPPELKRIAVMHHPSQRRVDDVIAAFAPDWVQTDVEDFDALEIPSAVATLPVYRDGSSVPVDKLPRRIVFEGRISGSGKTADWDEARALAERTEVILAGGLSADNIVQAVDRVQPFGVDVSSGVESTRGKKDPQKIREFVARVRAMEHKQ